MTQPPFTPVPVSPRHDGWTPERQWAFVEALADTASVTQAARIAGMGVRSAQKLRRHPQAAEFRAAWDAALAQAFGSLEQVALDRAINGEVETIERDGIVIATRRRVYSDRLLIHLLKYRETRSERARGLRVAAHEQALAAARLAGIQARAVAPGKKAPTPPPPELRGDAEAEAAAEAEALTAFAAHARAFADWPALAGVMPEPGPPVALAPADGRIPLRMRPARVKLPAQVTPAPDAADVSAADEPGILDAIFARWQRDYDNWDGREETRPEPVKYPSTPEVRIRTL